MIGARTLLLTDSLTNVCRLFTIWEWKMISYPVWELEQFSRPDWPRLGLAMSPFSIEADPRFMYLSADTRRALSKVSFMVEAGQGHQSLSARLAPVNNTRLLVSRTVSKSQGFCCCQVDEPPKRSGLLLLRRVAAEFDIRTRRATEDQLNEFRAFWCARRNKKMLPLIIIDEAHELSDDQFMELRRLLNFRDPRWQRRFS